MIKIVNSRQGAACVELAITLPVLLIIALGAIEIFNMIAARQNAFRVAFETSRAVSQFNLSNSEAISLAKKKLADVDMSGDVILDVNQSLDPEFELVTVQIATQPSNHFSLANVTRGMRATGSASTVRRASGSSPDIRLQPPKRGRGRGRKK